MLRVLLLFEDCIEEAPMGQGVGRFGFEYFGPSDSSNYLGIDTVTVTAVPEPGTYLLMGLGLAALGALRSRKAARESTL